MNEPGKPTQPLHLGIIMDGNGRWALSRSKPRSEGHRKGLEVAKEIVLVARNLGLRYLSLYVFSTENWKRAAEEVGFLMGLIKTYLRTEFEFYRDNGIRIIHSGEPKGLSPDVLQEIRHVEADTAGFTGMTLNLAINYGGRDEILRAVGRIAARYDGKLPILDEESMSACMDRPDLPDPDLIIRTGGECRLSNFLLWEAAYSELWFSDKLWPDFTKDDLVGALEDYRMRNRRFGAAE